MLERSRQLQRLTGCLYARRTGAYRIRREPASPLPRDRRSGRQVLDDGKRSGPLHSPVRAFEQMVEQQLLSRPPGPIPTFIPAVRPSEHPDCTRF